jgi:MFS family permease
MNQEPTTAEKLRGLPWSIGFSTANAVFVQLTYFGSVFVLFLSDLGLSKTQIGSLLSIFSFFDLIALFIAPTVARWGYKRTFLSFWGARNVVTLFLLLTPWILARFGSQTMLVAIVAIAIGFATCRSVAMTALYPWMQEYIPNGVRGKYTALENILSSVAAFLAVTGAGYVLGPSPELGRFLILFGVGVVAGGISIWSFSHVPGGASTRGTKAERTSHRDLARAARDRNFRRYLIGAGLISLATVPLTAFLPLFMKEQVGLSPGKVVWLETGTLLGGLLSSYLWGWAADRYGSKPVMLSGLLLLVFLPLCWWLMPRQSVWSLYLALGVAFLYGLSSLGWRIGSGRLLYVSVVPAEEKTAYLALYAAWNGIVSGLSKLIGGRIVDFSANISGRFLIFPLDPYTLLFAAGIVLPIASGLLLKGVRADSSVTMKEFAAMFLRGNPFRAAESLIRYRRARGERAIVSAAERLGQTQSPLTVEELLELLADPRFNVRFEALVSIARREPDPRLLEALVQILGGNEPALSVIAAWALGRIGDPRAREPLRAGLGAPYRSVRAHSARALSTLNDTTVVPLLLERLATETDPGLRMAYASALGKLRAQASVDRLLALLCAAQEEASRMELALALARIVGDEHHFIQLWRQMGEDPGTSASQVVTAIGRQVRQQPVEAKELTAALEACAGALAREELESGAALLSRAIGLLPLETVDETSGKILDECAARLEEWGFRRSEYLLLALHTLYVSVPA